jgi:hypothetical protein
VGLYPLPHGYNDHLLRDLWEASAAISDDPLRELLGGLWETSVQLADPSAVPHGISLVPEHKTQNPESN